MIMFLVLVKECKIFSNNEENCFYIMWLRCSIKKNIMCNIWKSCFGLMKVWKVKVNFFWLIMFVEKERWMILKKRKKNYF